MWREVEGVAPGRAARGRPSLRAAAQQLPASTESLAIALDRPSADEVRWTGR